MEAPILHPRLSATLEAFRVAGVDPSDAEIAWLVTLRRPCDNPADGSVPWVMGAPLNYGGVDWFPMHRLADSWFGRAFKLLDGNEHDQILVFLFAHARSAPGDATLRGIMGADLIAATVREWFNDLPIHDEQLDALVDRLQVLNGDAVQIPDPDRKPEKETQAEDKSAQFAALMCKAFPACGPEYWLSGIGSHDAESMLDNVNAENFADSAKRTEAIANYLKAVKWIWSAHSG